MGHSATDMGTQPSKPAHRLAESVFEQYGRQLQRYLMSCLRHRHNARDLEQEVYLRLLRVPDAELVQNVMGYVHRIAVHVVHEYRLRARRERVTFDSDIAEQMAERETEAALDPDPLAERLSTVRQLEQLVRQLPPVCRDAFILHKCHGLSREEVAKQLGLSENTVKIYVNRALASLRTAQWDR
jgi:RNA polymerase sigma factor (sigma-70 family)